MYEKTGSNHLQVKIQGVERVFHTGSTPSDYKSLLNFIGDVKAELHRLEQQELETRTATDVIESPPSTLQPGQEPGQEVQIQRMAQTIIKSIRMNFDRIKDREYNMFFEQETPDAAQIAQFRADFVESEFAKAMKNKKDTDYFTKAAIKKGKDQVMEHLDFMLPTPAYYHEQLKQHISKQRPNQDSEQATPEPRLPAQAVIEQAVIEQANAAVENKKAASLDEEAVGSVSSPFVLADLMKEKGPKRIRLLKTLPKNHLALLIEDSKVALEQKHQEDIQQLIQLMQEKGIELTELQQAVQS
ncbi:hypothetical protein [Marinospirillum sp.]|uniref:hypothetical protein n=1 Tax=Marinospirillum sp. TaxID=2183934 RepID=UPI0025C24664|nr:hypothetical protein [Marinospirillum sp.]